MSFNVDKMLVTFWNKGLFFFLVQKFRFYFYLFLLWWELMSEFIGKQRLLFSTS